MEKTENRLNRMNFDVFNKGVRMSPLRRILVEIFGKKVPKTATQFYTADGMAVFHGGRIKDLCQFSMNAVQIVSLKDLGLMGSRGWTI